MLCTLDFYLETPKEIAIVGRGDQRDTQALLRRVHATYVPNKILLLVDPATDPGDAFAHLPLGEMTSIEGKATAYVCHQFACSAPTTSAEALAELLK
jgi:uncharacterized protein YyaL (SSP411 family)